MSRKKTNSIITVRYADGRVEAKRPKDFSKPRRQGVPASIRRQTHKSRSLMNRRHAEIDQMLDEALRRDSA